MMLFRLWLFLALWFLCLLHPALVQEIMREVQEGEPTTELAWEERLKRIAELRRES